MAVTVTPVLAGTAKNISDVEATADADNEATIPHGLAAAPESVTVTPLAGAARTSLPVVTGIDGTNVVVAMTTSAGSGAAGDQFRVEASLPHSLVS